MNESKQTSSVSVSVPCTSISIQMYVAALYYSLEYFRRILFYHCFVYVSFFICFVIFSYFLFRFFAFVCEDLFSSLLFYANRVVSLVFTRRVSRITTMHSDGTRCHYKWIIRTGELSVHFKYDCQRRYLGTNRSKPFNAYFTLAHSMNANTGNHFINKHRLSIFYSIHW